MQLVPTTEEEASYFYKRKFSIVNGMHTVLGFMTLREKAPGVRLEASVEVSSNVVSCCCCCRCRCVVFPLFF